MNLQTSSDSASSASSSAEERPYLVLVRYGELALKGKNRGFFERKLASNIRSACEGLSKVRVELRRGRIMVWPDSKPERVAKRIQDVMGIQSVSLARGVPLDPELIAEEGLRSVQ